MTQLRPYQQELLNNILTAFKTSNAVVGQSPTAAGKTIVAETLIADLLSVAPEGQIIFAVHRLELVEQASASFTSAGIPHSFISSQYEYNPTNHVYICTIQTLHRKLQYITNPVVMIIDECHLAKSVTYEKTINHVKSLGGKILGITATPKGGLDHVFDELVLGPTIKQLIEQGWLAIPKIYVPQKTAELVAQHEGEWTVKQGDYDINQLDKFLLGNKLIYGDTVEHCRKLNPDNKPSVVFCSSLKHVYETVEMLNSAGLKAAGIDGTMSKSVRKELLQSFRSGVITYMVSCQLLLEGYDFPECFMGVWLRPTKSLVVWLQGNGRLMRIMNQKNECVILDQVNNTAILGPSFIDRHWYIEGRINSKATISGINKFLCTRCGNYIKTGLLICPHCGKVFKSKSKIFKTIYEDLQCITIESAQQLITDQCQKILNKEKWKMLKTLEDFKQHAADKKYSNPDEWAEKAFARKQAEDHIYFNGDEDQLTDLFMKRKKENPRDEAKKVLAKRAELHKDGKNRQVVQVFESGTLDEIIAELSINPLFNDPNSKRYVTPENRERYGKGCLKKRLAPVFAEGTPEQKTDARNVVEGPDPNDDKFTQMVKFAKSGKVTPLNETAPRVLTDEEAEKFARNVVRKQVKADLESKDPVRVREAVVKMHVINVDAYVKTVLEGENK